MARENDNKITFRTNEKIDSILEKIMQEKGIDNKSQGIKTIIEKYAEIPTNYSKIIKEKDIEINIYKNFIRELIKDNYVTDEQKKELKRGL